MIVSKMKDLGPLKYVLGIEVARNSAGLFLGKRKYTLGIISEVGMLGAKPCGFPIEQNHHLFTRHNLLSSCGELDFLRRYVHALIFPTPFLSYLSVPMILLKNIGRLLLRVVRYLVKGSLSQGLLLHVDI